MNAYAPMQRSGSGFVKVFGLKILPGSEVKRSEKVEIFQPKPGGLDLY
jgi:hypothetical protein